MAVAPRSLAPRAIGAILLGIAAYYAIWGGEYTAFDLYRLEKRQEAEAARVAELTTELDSLHAVIDRLENDPATIEAVARERFGMIRRGEVLYRFLDIGDDPEAELDAIESAARAAGRP